MRRSLTTQHIETLIIGAGQAGLATGYHLRQLGRQLVIVDSNERIGDNWRCYWDSLRLFTPAEYDGLPGLAFPGDRWSFPSKDDAADYLDTYAVQSGTDSRVSRPVRATEEPDGGILTAQGRARARPQTSSAEVRAGETSGVEA